ncbi:MAG: Flp family type IVb pilin [Rhodospirillales bacterium]|nr:Flp family type IVb pilin [Rhodospirillales bacterium]
MLARHFRPPKVLARKALTFGTNRSGATAIEYALIVAGIAVAILSVIFTLGTEINNVFSDAQIQVKGRGK